MADQLCNPVTEAELARVSAADDKAALAQKLYFSSFLVAKRPHVAWADLRVDAGRVQAGRFERDQGVSLRYETRDRTHRC